MITNEWRSGKDDLSEAFDIRKIVFVGEQGCDAQKDKDEHDAEAMHVIVRVDGKAAATGRFYYDVSHKAFKIGRICALSEYRGQGIGDLVVKVLLYKAAQFAQNICVSAQTRVRAFYERYGFKAQGSEYIEENIPHIFMTVKADEIIYPSKCGGHGAER